MTKLTELLGIELPIIQAPMAGAQAGAMAIAVSNAGGLGSLPCAMLTADGLRKELEAIKAQTSKPFNVNFFCHKPPVMDAARESAWREKFAPYYRKYGIDPQKIPAGPGRVPFTAEAADLPTRRSHRPGFTSWTRMCRRAACPSCCQVCGATIPTTSPSPS